MSPPNLTIGVYARASLHMITGAVETLPDLTTVPRTESAVLASTGKDPAVRSRINEPELAAQGQRAADGSGQNLSAAVANEGLNTPPRESRKPLELSGFGASCRSQTGVGRAGIEPATPGFSVLCSTS